MRTIEWKKGTVLTPDQTRLPLETVTLQLKTCDEMAEAIKNLRVRGAPLLGVAAAFGIALAAYHSKANSKEKLLAEMEEAAKMIKQTRPTAVNLFWATDRILSKARGSSESAEKLKVLVVEEAQKIADEDAAQNRAIRRGDASFRRRGTASS